ncbi:hypothetical protein QAD02_011702 [Eretmocerus hayati]|uniref:Uncharacterized protein n=1 Tax=Eretmocerus hayati TaxID=131215 RepID=A0ACC2NYP9_9HYME|nr:hypothetical protein QAD02_011702 [Eretmocerus hayati]
MHLETHYARIMRGNGPVVLDSAIRFEAEHQEFKATAAATKCKKNLLKTLAIKHQLKFCYRAHRTDFLEEVEKGPSVEVDQAVINKYFPHVQDKTEIESFESVKIWGTLIPKIQLLFLTLMRAKVQTLEE